MIGSSCPRSADVISPLVETGLLVDRSAVFGVLGQIEALGLELLEHAKSGRDANRLNQAVLAHLTAWEAEPTSPSESRASHANSNRS